MFVFAVRDADGTQVELDVVRQKVKAAFGERDDIVAIPWITGPFEAELGDMESMKGILARMRQKVADTDKADMFVEDRFGLRGPRRRHRPDGRSGAHGVDGRIPAGARRGREARRTCRARA